MKLYYLSSSGEKIDFFQFNTRIKEGNFHAYEWQYEYAELSMGSNIYGFKRPAITYEILLSINGSFGEKVEELENMTDIFEKEIISLKPGALYFNNQYINSYVVASEITPTEYGVERTITLLCPYPMWKTDLFFEMLPSEPSSTGMLDYDYDYQYDYTQNESGLRKIYINHYAQNQFIMNIFGPVIDPSININGHTYKVFGTYSTGEYITIDSVNYTVVKHDYNGNVVNCFDSRYKEESIFEPIPSGEVTFRWQGNFGFNITVVTERSEPRWTT